LTAFEADVRLLLTDLTLCVWCSLDLEGGGAILLMLVPDM